jgi:hypothetical protein
MIRIRIFGSFKVDNFLNIPEYFKNYSKTTEKKSPAFSTYQKDSLLFCFGNEPIEITEKLVEKIII